MLGDWALGLLLLFGPPHNGNRNIQRLRYPCTYEVELGGGRSIGVPTLLIKNFRRVR